MESKTCSLDDCKGVYYAKGLCSKHYTRSRRGTLFTIKTPKVCNKKDCDKKHHAKGLCKNHYRHQRKIDKIWRG